MPDGLDDVLAVGVDGVMHEDSGVRVADDPLEVVSDARLVQPFLEGNAAVLEFESTSLVALQQSISGLLESEMQKLMVARGNSEYAFRVIDRAEVPRVKSKPRVLLIVAVAMVFGGMLSVFAVLMRDMIASRKQSAGAG